MRGHSSVVKAYVEMKNARYNPDGTPKERATNSATDKPEHRKVKPFRGIMGDKPTFLRNLLS